MIEQAVGTHGGLVRINRLRAGYTWNIDVAADTNSIEDLRVAKQKALEILRELEAEFTPTPVDEQVTEEEVAF